MPCRNAHVEWHVMHVSPEASAQEWHVDQNAKNATGRPDPALTGPAGLGHGV